MTTPTLHICITCGENAGEGTQGQRLHDEIAALGLPEGVALAPVRCLSLCGRGVAGCLSDPAKWSWLLSDLQPGQGKDLVEYLQAYARSGSGVVLPSRRPQSLQRAVCGRVPKLAS